MPSNSENAYSGSVLLPETSTGLFTSVSNSSLVQNPFDVLNYTYNSASANYESAYRTESTLSPGNTNSPVTSAAPFTSGIFTVGSTGQVSINYLFDGGGFQGELAIFSLHGLEQLGIGTPAFIQEVARRALSNSDLGHVVVSDQTEGARFTGSLPWEGDFNSGEYRGVKSFSMLAGSQFGVMLVPNGTVQEVYEHPSADGHLRPLFSLTTANPNEVFQFGQIADVNGRGNTFTMEDLRLDRGSDRDYNDIIFQVRGAIGSAVSLDQVIDPYRDWRKTDLGQNLMRFIQPPKNQPLIGVIDTGLSPNPDIDPYNIHFGSGSDYVAGDGNPLLQLEEGNQHGTHITGIIAATRDNGIGIDGINGQAPIYVQRAVGSGKWAQALVDFVDAAKEIGQPHAIANLSFDLTQLNPDGTTTTRYEFTPEERKALEYARQNGVLIVAAAGNEGGTMSALGQASQEFDNIVTVGAIDYNGKRTDYSSFGHGLDLVAYGGTTDQPVMSTVGSGVDLPQFIRNLNLQWNQVFSPLQDQANSIDSDDTHSSNLSAWNLQSDYSSAGDITGQSLSSQSSLGTQFFSENDENLSDDEMAKNARNIFEEVFGSPVSVDESELETFTPEEQQAYDEATKEIDQLLNDYLAEASQKLALEYVDGYYGIQVDALSQFVNAFDENVAQNLIQAQEILKKAGYDIQLPNDSDASTSTPLDLGVGWMAGTSVATAKVTGVASQVWASNPDLNYLQIKNILKQTATDLGTPGWDLETGAGAVDLEKAVELAKKTQPETYQPVPILSPLTWTGENTLFPGERPVWVSVPSFSGHVMNIGEVTLVGYQRIRSGPGTNFSQVGIKYPGETITFDAYENNGSRYTDTVLGISSTRWYRIAGTNNWMWAGFIDNNPEQAEQERQRQEAIRQAEEAQRQAEEELRKAQEAARQAEEELNRIEAEQQRQREAFQALVNGITQTYGDPGLLMGNWVSNGVTVYQFTNGQAFIQPDGRVFFYLNDITRGLGIGSLAGDAVIQTGQVYNGGVLDDAYWAQRTISSQFGSNGKLTGWTYASLAKAIKEGRIKPADVEVDYIIRDGETFILNTRTSNALEAAGVPRENWNVVNKTGDTIAEGLLDGQLKNNKLINEKTGQILIDELNQLRQTGPRLTGNSISGEVPKVPAYGSSTFAEGLSKGAKGVGRAVVVLGLAWDTYQLYNAYQADGQQFGQNFQATAGSVAGGWAGGIAGAWAGAQAGALLGGAIGSIIPGAGTAAGAAVGGLVGGLIGGVAGSLAGSELGEWVTTQGGTALNNALQTARENAKAAFAKANQLAESARNTLSEVQKQVESAKVAYQSFKVETQKKVSLIVQESQQKVQEIAQSIAQKVMQNPLVQTASKVFNQVANYANKAIQAVSNAINGAKQFFNNVVETGKQIVNNVIQTGKQAYETVSNFVSSTVNQGAQVAAATYNAAAQAVNNVTNFVSGGFSGVKSLFGW